MTAPVDQTKDGTTLNLVTATLVEQTLTVPATLDTEFGFRLVVHGAPAGKLVNLRVVSLYPPTTDEITGKTTTQDEVPLQVGLEDSKDAGVYLKLDKRSDLVPGTWTIQLFDHDKKLLEKTFTLVKP